MSLAWWRRAMGWPGRYRAEMRRREAELQRWKRQMERNELWAQAQALLYHQAYGGHAHRKIEQLLYAGLLGAYVQGVPVHPYLERLLGLGLPGYLRTLRALEDPEVERALREFWPWRERPEDDPKLLEYGTAERAWRRLLEGCGRNGLGPKAGTG